MLHGPAPVSQTPLQYVQLLINKASCTLTPLIGRSVSPTEFPDVFAKLCHMEVAPYV